MDINSPNEELFERVVGWRGTSDGPVAWKTGSALQSIRLRLFARGEPTSQDGIVATIGAPGAWSATGQFVVEWTGGAMTFSWRGPSKLAPLGSAARPFSPSGEWIAINVYNSAFPFGGEYGWHVAADERGGNIALGNYWHALPFRPYPVLGDELRVEVRRSPTAPPGAEPDVVVEHVQAEVAAPRGINVALGDSQIHAGLVASALRKLSAPGMVISGKAGGDSAGALARMATDVFPFKPRHLLLWVGSNDIGYAEADGRGAEAGIATALANIDEIVGEAQSRGIECHLLGALPRGMPIIREFNRRLALLAGSRRAGFHDAYEVLHRRNDKMDLRYSDGLHPNADGAELLAKHFAEQGLVDALGH